MTYKISGVEIPTQPTTGRWIPRTQVGVDGNGHVIYVGVREYELRWRLSDPTNVAQLQTWFESVGNTGTVVVDLPYYLTGTYGFYSYSGCVLREPEIGNYFTEHHQSVLLLVTNINT